MKTNYLLFFAMLAFVTFSVNSYGQDIITLKNGEDVKSKILEVGITEVKYKKFDNLEGPSYTLTKAEIFMIKYQNGTKDVFKTETEIAPVPTPSKPTQYNGENTGSAPISPEAKKKVDNDLKNYNAQQDYNKNYSLYKSRLRTGIASTAIGVPFTVIGIALVGYGASLLSSTSYYSSGSSYYDTYYGQGVAFVLTGVVLAAVGIPLTIVGPVKIASSFKYKRKANEAKASISFEPKIAPTGIGSSERALGVGGGLGIRIRF